MDWWILVGVFVFWVVLYGLAYNGTMYLGVKFKLGPEWERQGRQDAERGFRWSKEPYDKDWVDRMITGYYNRGYAARIEEIEQEREAANV